MSPMEPIFRPITRERLRELAEAGFGDMIKAVVDCRRRIMVVGGELHGHLWAASMVRKRRARGSGSLRAGFGAQQGERKLSDGDRVQADARSSSRHRNVGSVVARRAGGG